jgi:hypothetical protein
MKYKVGDKVKIRSDLKNGSDYGQMNFVTEMKRFLGEIVAITYAGSGTYLIEEDNREWFWTDEMIEGLAETGGNYSMVVKTGKETGETKPQQDIPYINAEEARKMCNPYVRADELRKLIYTTIREVATKDRCVFLQLCGYSSEIVSLIVKELEFKGFSATTRINTLIIRW